jgi:uncharacterized membrane protein YdfJ with MMPL/SSD domain
VDYNLFLVSRWREEVVDGASHSDAVRESLATAGHTVLVSGFTLICCCFGLLMVPVDVIQSLGIASAVIVMCAMIINLTLTPALLYTFPRYFNNGIKEEAWFRCQSDQTAKPTPKGTLTTTRRRGTSRGKDAMPLAETSVNAEAESLQLLDPADYASGSADHDAAARARAKNSRRLKKGGWYRFGEFVTRSWHPYAIVVCMLALCGYLAYPAVTFGKVGGTMCFAAVNDPALHVYENTFTPLFGAGRLFPYALVVTVGDSHTSALPMLVASAQQTLSEVHPQLVQISSFQSHIVSSGNQSLDGGCGVLRNRSETEYAMCTEVYQAWWGAGYVGSNVSAGIVGEPTTAMLEFGLQVDPWGADGSEWLPQARMTLDALEGKFSAVDARLYLAQGAGVDIDLISIVYGSFWHTIA